MKKWRLVICDMTRQIIKHYNNVLCVKNNSSIKSKEICKHYFSSAKKWRLFCSDWHDQRNVTMVLKNDCIINGEVYRYYSSFEKKKVSVIVAINLLRSVLIKHFKIKLCQKSTFKCIIYSFQTIETSTM